MSALRPLQWRAALSIIGAVLVVAWVMMSGRTSYIVQIDFNMGREMLEGAVVEIDRDSVGTLKRYGRSQFVTGFRVEPGEHEVRVLKEGCTSDADTVALGAGGSRMAVLMAELQDGYGCQVVLNE